MQTRNSRISTRVSAVLGTIALTAGALTGLGLGGSAAHADSDPLEEGLVAWYKLDETSGTSAANSASGSAFGAATLMGGAAWNGDGVTLDGTDDYIDLPDNLLAGLDSITVSFDVTIDPSQSTPYFLYGMGNTTSAAGDGYLFATGDAFRNGIASGNWTTENNVTKGSPLARGVVKHVTYTQTGTVGTLYEDGTRVAQNTSVAITPASIKNGVTTANYIGKSVYTGDRTLKGKVADFRIYDRALSGSEVASLAGNFTALAGIQLDQLKVDPIIDSVAKTVVLPVVPGTDVTSLAPTLTVSTQSTVVPANGSAQDFTQPVSYTVTGPNGDSDTWSVSVLLMRSPVIPGLYADPNIVQFGDTFYIYATTDGIDGWMGDHFEVWSSQNLVDWTNHGTILTLGTDVPWADLRAWAPAAIEKNGKYYFYFSASQNIGVAVADAPTGPFTEPLGQPLVNKANYSNAQQIDPAAFTDDDGTSYLLWGNGTPRMVPLNADMISYDQSKVKTISGLTGFREGLFLNKRDGIYHLTYSIDDTGSENYRVGYATSTSINGPWHYEGVILKKDKSQGILGTGHHSIVQVAGTDQWFIAYHRFAIPGGNGFHRETTIDELHFDEQGLMETVIPTLTSIEPLDSTAPELDVEDSLAPGAQWATGPVTITATAADDSGAAPVIQYRLDGDSWVHYDQPVVVIGDGEHTVDVRAKDGRGNTSEVQTREFSIDTTAPVTQIEFDGDARSVTAVATDGNSGVERTEYRWGTTGAWKNYIASVPVPAKLSTLQFRSVDRAGNVEEINQQVIPAADVVPSDTATAAVVATSRVQFGASGTVTVRVTGDGTAPTGVVRVLSGSTLLGSATLKTGRATVTLTQSAKVGTHALTVVYPGDGTHAASSDTAAYTVVKATSTAKATISPKRVMSSKRAKVTVAVSASTRVTVAGKATITVKRAGKTVKTATVSVSKGKAGLTLPTLKKGSYRLKVSYKGSATVSAASITTSFTVAR